MFISLPDPAVDQCLKDLYIFENIINSHLVVDKKRVKLRVVSYNLDIVMLGG